ncbi:MAG: hypothetical protein LBJ76_00210, partial [Candidatus Accumulibacter sp.]|nr:hypothetical protein [Accumulibacter sp.]
SEKPHKKPARGKTGFFWKAWDFFKKADFGCSQSPWVGTLAPLARDMGAFDSRHGAIWRARPRQPAPSVSCLPQPWPRDR